MLSNFNPHFSILKREKKNAPQKIILIINCNMIAVMALESAELDSYGGDFGWASNSILQQ